MIGAILKIISGNFENYNDKGTFELFKTTLYPRKKPTEIVMRTIDYQDGKSLVYSSLTEPKLVNLIGMFAIIFSFDMNIFLI